MAFQDNSGGIILDATLTDIGRKYMAQGKFKVTKFALGDDEINYALVSGAVNTVAQKIPLGVMPPVLEAFGGQQSNINYGLISLPRNDLLYIPIFKINTKVDGSVEQHLNGFIHLAANKETGRKLESDLGTSTKVLYANRYEKNSIIIESGITVPADDGTSGESITTDLRPTEKNKKAYILNMGLYDKHCLVYADSKFVDCVYVSRTDGKYENDNNDNLYYSFLPLQKTHRVSLPSISDDHEVYRIETINSRVFYKTSTTSGNSHSMFQGPRAAIFAVNLKIEPELTSDSQGAADTRYKLFGNRSSNLFGTGNLYDFIDTTIYIEGLSSNARLQIPIRITRFVGTST